MKSTLLSGGGYDAYFILWYMSYSYGSDIV